MTIMEGPPAGQRGLGQSGAGLVDILGPWPPLPLFPSAFSSFCLSLSCCLESLVAFLPAEGGASAGAGSKVLSRDW